LSNRRWPWATAIGFQARARRSDNDPALVQRHDPSNDVRRLRKNARLSYIAAGHPKKRDFDKREGEMKPGVLL
jgi:hypothetical protein